MIDLYYTTFLLYEIVPLLISSDTDITLADDKVKGLEEYIQQLEEQLKAHE